MKKPICMTLTDPLLVGLSNYLKGKGYRNVSIKKFMDSDPYMVVCDITHSGQPVVPDRRVYHATFYTDVDEWCKKNEVVYRDTVGSYEVTIAGVPLTSQAQNPPYEYSVIELCDKETEDGCQIGGCAKAAECIKMVDGDELHVCSDHAFESDDESDEDDSDDDDDDGDGGDGDSNIEH